MAGLLLTGCESGREAAGQPSPEVAESAAAGARAGSQVAIRFSERSERTVASNYLLYLPEAYDDDADRSWPLIVHLHGGGGRGTDPERLRAYPLVQRLENEPDFPFIVVSPQCPPGRPGPLGDLWTEHDDLVLAVLDEVTERYRVDEERVSLIGHSMGGNGAWYLGHRAPERFAAIVPIAAPGVTWWTFRIAEAGIPTWVFHGENDQVVPPAEARRMVEALKEAGGDVRLTTYPEGGHALREPFEDAALFDWLLEQRRGKVGRAPQ